MGGGSGGPCGQEAPAIGSIILSSSRESSANMLSNTYDSRAKYRFMLSWQFQSHRQRKNKTELNHEPHQPKNAKPQEKMKKKNKKKQVGQWARAIRCPKVPVSEGDFFMGRLQKITPLNLVLQPRSKFRNPVCRNVTHTRQTV